MTNRLFFCFSLLLTLIFLKTVLLARDFAMVHYTTDNGLPSNTIYSIYKDHKGNLWMCSDKGIARYNGLEFEKFTTSDGLPDNEIFFFKEDNYNRLWLATFNGELCYYKSDTFYNAGNSPFLKLPFKKSYIQDILLAQDSSVVIGFYDRAKWVTITHNSRAITSFEKSINPFDTSYYYLNKVTNNRFEILFPNKILEIDSNSNILREEYFKNGRTYKYSIAQDQHYFYTNDSIYTLKSEPLAAMNKHAYAQRHIYHIYFYDGNYFFCTDKGLYINNNIHAFQEYKISGIERDVNGNYWISTLGNGVFSLSKDFLAINKYKDCYNGSIRYAQAFNDVVFYATDRNNVYRFDSNGTTCLLNYSRIHPGNKLPDYLSFIIDNKNIFYSFYDTNIMLIDSIYAANPSLKMYTSKFTGGYKSVFANNGLVYLKRFRTIEYIDFSKAVTNSSTGNPSVVTLLPYIQIKERLFGMAQSPDSIFWYSTVDSVYKIVDGRSVAQPQYRNITFKWFDILGNYLVGCTHDNKLAICNNIDGKMYFEMIEGHSCIWDRLCKLDANHFLLCTNNLYRILTVYPSNVQPKYSIAVIENPFIPRNAEDVCSNGSKCFFFKDGSITSVDLNILLAKPQAPTLSFGKLKAGENVYTIKNEVAIPFSDARNISISFSTLAFSGSNVSYQYSISEDDNDNWLNLHGDLNLIRLGYGFFKVKVRAKSISSNFCEPISFTLHVLRPYWATWWFITLSILAALFVLIMLIRYRIAGALLKKQQIHDNEIRFIKSEYKAMNALMNPHFIFNTLNDIQDLINKNDKRAANEYLRFFADLIRQNMHNISKELVSLQKELNLVTNYLLLEKLRFEDCLNYTINVDEHIDTSEIMIPPLLIQPLVENAIKHGIYPMQSAEGQIRIIVREDDNRLYIEVMDNGIGMDAAQNNSISSHESFGLHSIKTRIEQLSLIQNKEIQFQVSDICDDNGKHQWTVISIIIQIA